jgi:D-alanyl-D-alanine carboxypeptidase/D-alanyl-D-alanine-endopeptidase (penicillin-binding protein 4)
MILLATAVALDALLSVPDLDGAVVCATVADQNGRILYDRLGGIRVEPASNEKLFSAAFALWELGQDYRPTTYFWKRPDRIVVQSMGDPSLTHDQLVDVRKELGLDGTLPVVVNEAYGPGIPERWEVGDLSNRYAAPVAAFSVDQSAFELWNSNGRLELRPAPYGVSIRAIRSANAKPVFAYDPLKREVTCSGAFPRATARLDTLAVPSAEEAAASLLGRLAGRTATVPTDSPSKALQGRPLKEILSVCLHRSDNNIAENLLLMAAAHEGPLPENCYPDALERLEDFEHRIVGIGPNETLPRDGSGLTRENFVTTHAIVKLLAWAESQPTAEVWRQSLASPGSGTLLHRLGPVDASGRSASPAVTFFGKTGSLSNVTALSGYLETQHGEKLIVSVIINNFSCRESRAVEAIDRFVREISERGL